MVINCEMIVLDGGLLNVSRSAVACYNHRVPALLLLKIEQRYNMDPLDVVESKQW